MVGESAKEHSRGKQHYREDGVKKGNPQIDKQVFIS
jgi:hypothetical protein